MRIATWNVNSVRSRLERLLDWLGRHEPDVLCLQELKTVEETFPFDVLREIGYHAVVCGQKTYNGVAIISRSEPTDIRRGFAVDDNDPQARLISAVIDGVRIFSAYFPNGGEVGSDKFTYKLQWMDRLRTMFERKHSSDESLVLCGDFNVAIGDLDVAVPERWADTVLCVPEVRAALRKISDWGWTDVFRVCHPEESAYSWWDYRRLAFVHNDGLRIDYIFATSPLAAKCTGVEIDREERKGQKPSDHAPVIASFE